MNILIIEDNQLKREKICNFLSENFAATLYEASSYNSGLNAMQSRTYDLLVLDMSMPTFDRSTTTNGGRFRPLGGKEIAIRLQKQNRLIPFVVVTGYSDFSVNAENLSISQIDESLRTLGKEYQGCVFFDAVESVWKENLLEIVRRIA